MAHGSVAAPHPHDQYLTLDSSTCDRCLDQCGTAGNQTRTRRL